MKNEAIRKWIYVEQDAAAIGVNRPIDVPLVGDLRGVVPQLVAALKDTPRAPAPGLAKFMKDGQAELDSLAEESLTKSDGNGDVPIHTSRFVVEATKAFPKDGIMIRDGGATVIFQWTYSQCKPHDVIWNQNFGHIGTGLPYATGAMLADAAATKKQRPGMLLTSDSSFLFHIGELETAVRCKLPLVCVVGVDYQWGLEVGVYKRTFGQGTAETGTHWGKSLRFDKIGEGFGCHGEYVTKAAGHRPGHQARLCQRQGRRGPRRHRPEGEFGGNAEIRRVPDVVRRRNSVISNADLVSSDLAPPLRSGGALVIQR